MAKKKELKRELRLTKALLEHALYMRKAIERDFEKAVGKTWEDWTSVEYVRTSEPQNLQPTSSLLEDVKQEPNEDTSKYFKVS